jgi:CNT family concentrative nucleoside transporter
MSNNTYESPIAPNASAAAAEKPIQRRTSGYSEEKEIVTTELPTTYMNRVDEDIEKSQARRAIFWSKYRPFILTGVATMIFGWWVSATVLKATRHRWIVQTFFAWFLIIVIAWRFIPNSVVTRPVGAFWLPCVQDPWLKLHRNLRLAIGWLCLLGIIFGSAFGFKPVGNSNYGDRAISVAGLFVFQFCFWASSKKRSEVPWPTVIVGLFMQQAIALFVLKSGAGFSIFKWIATLASDFLNQSRAGAQFFFDAETVSKGWFFVNTLSAIIFFIAFIQMMYYTGVMQWIIKAFAWFFFKLMDISGAEAVVASASPWVGQGESACLVKPYVSLMTPSELHLTMTSGFSTISGSVLIAYVNLGVPAQTLITSSVMSIPASIAISKMRMPEIDEPVTRGRVVVDRGETDGGPANALHAFSLGALFGLIVAGQILANVLTILSLVAAINGLLTWIGRGFGIHALTLQLVLRYIFYPVAFFLSVPRAEILPVAELLATKLVANEFQAYSDLHAIMGGGNPLSQRAFNIASYSLCGFGNLGALGIQIGVLGALAPSQAKVIVRVATSAMICGFISTLQTAGIAGMLL